MMRYLLPGALALLMAVPAMAGESDKDPGIQWFGTLEGGLNEAKRTGKPILLMSGAPQCRTISGLW